MTHRNWKLIFCLGNRTSKTLLPFFLLATLFFPTLVHATDGADFFIVKKVFIRIPHSSTPEINESATGLLQAQKIAFKRLIQKMLTVEERKTRIVFIKDIQLNIKDLLQRSIIVSEKQHTRDVEMTIDIHFSKEKIIRSLELAGINFCESPYPLSLFVMEDTDSSQWPSASIFSAFSNAAIAYGFEIIPPIKDMEDLANLSLMENPMKRNEVQNWAQTRYKTDKIWKIAVAMGELSEAKDKPNPTNLRIKMTEMDSDGVKYHFVKAFANETKPKGQKSSLENSALALVARVVDPWIAGHITMGGLSNFLDVTVTNSDNLDLMDAMIKKMESFSGVEKVSYLEMSSNQVKLRLQYTGNEQNIKDELKSLGAVDPGQGLEISIRLP